MNNFDNKCVSKIIKAHSVSRSKVLKEISSKINDNIIVGNFYRKNLYDPIPINQNIDVIYQDIRSASIFTGLCKYHDNALFNHIDKDPFNFNSEVNIFEYTLRNCIYSYYDKVSNLHGVILRKKIFAENSNADLTGTDDVYKSILKDKLALENDLNTFKVYLSNNDISNKILYKLYCYEGNINIAGNIKIIDKSNIYYITFVPNKHKSYILISSLKGKHIFEKNDFFEYLRSLTLQEFEIFLSKQLLKVGSIRYYFFNYDVYKNLDQHIQREIYIWLNLTHMYRFLGYDSYYEYSDCPNFINLMTRF